MTTLTKKEIRAVLAPMSRELLAGGRPKPIKFMGYTIEICRLNNGHGCTGPAWNPAFTVIAHDPDKKRAVMGGNLTETVERLHWSQGQVRDGFFFTEKAA